MCGAQKVSIYNAPSSLLHPSLGLGPGCSSSVTRVPAPIRQSEAWKPYATTTSVGWARSDGKTQQRQETSRSGSSQMYEIVWLPCQPWDRLSPSCKRWRRLRGPHILSSAGDAHQAWNKSGTPHWDTQSQGRPVLSSKHGHMGL